MGASEPYRPRSVGVAHWFIGPSGQECKKVQLRSHAHGSKKHGLAAKHISPALSSSTHPPTHLPSHAAIHVLAGGIHAEPEGVRDADAGDCGEEAARSEAGMRAGSRHRLLRQEGSTVRYLRVGSGTMPRTA